MKNALIPLSKSARIERIEVIDVLRGIALFGILVVNVEWFSRPWQELGHGMQPHASRLDYVVDWGVYLAARGKFLTLFALLFGMGFAVVSLRLDDGRHDFIRLYLRRSALLWVFGIAHALLLWSGDVLHAYALASLALLPVRRWSERMQLLLGLAIYVALCLSALLPSDAPRQGWWGCGGGQSALAAAKIYTQGDWWQVTVQRGRDFLRLLPHDRSIVPLSYALFLCGSWLVRSGRIVEVHANAGFFLRVAIFAGVFGGALTLLALYAGAAAGAVERLGALILAIGYIGAVAFAFTTRWLYRPLALLAPVGRMALTNYLLQSLLASTLFYGYGFGLWGQLGRAGQVLLALVIFALQVVFSHCWLGYFRHGPMEWLWRAFTYWQWPALRRR